MGDFDRLAKKIHDLKDDIEDEASDAAKEGAEDTRDQARRELSQNDSVVTGELASSIRVQREERNLAHQINAYRVVVEAKHGNVVEFGSGVFSSQGYRSPSGLPVENILEWIVEKGITPIYYETQVDLAFAISQTIESLGTRPHPFMRPSWFVMEPKVKRGIESGVQKAIRRA